MSSFFSQPVRLRIFSDFCDSTHGKNVYEEIFETQLMKDYGPTKRLYITVADDYTHAIIWNKAMPILLPTVPKENVIGLAYEPPHFLGITQHFVDYAQKYIGKYFIGDVGNLPTPFVGGKAYLSHMKPLASVVPHFSKKSVCSIMISQKMNAPGHIYRHKLVAEILKTNLPIDIYGRGCSFYSLLDPRIKGCFEEREPYEDYSFHICIENFQTGHYYSEKIINPLLCGTTPIYWGCKNIDDHFPGLVCCLSGDLAEDMNLLHHIVNYPNNYIKNVDIEKVKRDTNLLMNLDQLFVPV
jgi:hypothetical protein